MFAFVGYAKRLLKIIGRQNIVVIHKYQYASLGRAYPAMPRRCQSQFWLINVATTRMPRKIIKLGNGLRRSIID